MRSTPTICDSDLDYRWKSLLAAKNTQPIRSLDDLAADTFESDVELEEFLAFTYAVRQRDIA